MVEESLEHIVMECTEITTEELRQARHVFEEKAAYNQQDFTDSLWTLEKETRKLLKALAKAGHKI